MILQATTIAGIDPEQRSDPPGKLERTHDLNARDIFDVAVAAKEDPAALATALNMLLPEHRTSAIAWAWHQSEPEIRDRYTADELLWTSPNHRIEAHELATEPPTARDSHVQLKPLAGNHRPELLWKEHPGRYQMSTIKGLRLAGRASVTVENRPLALYRDVSNRSPTGHEWGFLGSGSAQLAIAILMTVTDRDETLLRAEAFRLSFTARIAKDSWTITTAQVEEWLRQHRERPTPHDVLPLDPN